jgi:endo-1,4-beta-xylanase
MLFLRSLVVAATAVVGVLATPSMLAPRQALVGNQEGTHDGYYYNYWTDGTADVEFHLGPAGAYNATWSGEGDWIGGKGWQPGSFTRYGSIYFARKINVRLIQKLI